MRNLSNKPKTGGDSASCSSGYSFYSPNELLTGYMTKEVHRKLCSVSRRKKNK